MYTTDPGGAIVQPFNLSQDQINAVQSFVNTQQAAINSGQEVYGIQNSNDCMNFVYGAANAAGITNPTDDRRRLAMNGGLPVVNGRQVLRALAKAGFVVERIVGSQTSRTMK